MDVYPQVNEPTVLNDPSQWKKIEGCFTANEAYEYLTIGNFFNDTQTVIAPVPTGRIGNTPYYLIDDVLVEEAGLTSLPVVNLGKDTTLCPSQEVTFRLPVLAAGRYEWQDGSTSLTYTVGQTGTYAVQAQVGRCAVSDYRARSRRAGGGAAARYHPVPG